MNNFFAIFGIISTTLVTMWATLKYIVLGSYKIDNDVSKRLITLIESEAKFKWILSSESVTDPRYPSVYEAIVIVRSAWFFLNRNERLLTAGWKSKEETSLIVFPRWKRKAVLNLLKRREIDDLSISVMALAPHGTDRLGELNADPNSEAIVDHSSDIEEEVKEVVEGKKNKTGLLLYGPPGNGKTQFIKHLSRKYSLPIYVVYLNPDYNNHDIAMMFASVPRRSIVLMEDFDNYFNKRECIMKNESVKFTFDAFINALDGVHNDYRQVIFAMTANDINKIDSSLTERPSRFRFVREFGPPSEAVRLKVLGDPKLIEETNGMSLDNVFCHKRH